MRQAPDSVSRGIHHRPGAAVRRCRESDPQGWPDYLAQANAALRVPTPRSATSGRRTTAEPAGASATDRGRTGRGSSTSTGTRSRAGKDRPALIVSSRFHLDLTLGQLVSVLPLTSVERLGWVHRVHVASGEEWVITEQTRTVSVTDFAGRHRRSACPATSSPRSGTCWRRCSLCSGSEESVSTSQSHDASSRNAELLILAERPRHSSVYRSL